MKFEGFQRARLDEQIRLSKKQRLQNGDGGNSNRNSNGSSNSNSGEFLADDEEEVTRMTDLFQMARLAEQLRLSKQASSHDPPGFETTNANTAEEDEDGGGRTHHHASSSDKDEAFQRALLEERLKLRRLQRHTLEQKYGSSRSENSSIEKAMMEYENEIIREEEPTKSLLATMTMVQEDEELERNMKDAAEEGEDGNDVPPVVRSDLVSGDDNNNKAVSTLDKRLPVNQTDDAPSKQLGDELETLHQMVAKTTSLPSSSARSSPASVATANNTISTSLQHFLSTTHLPLPPREDASLVGLALAPVAHLASSTFLFGAAAFYAIIAVLDVIWNDDKEEYCTRSCLKQTTSVCRHCWEYVFPSAATKGQTKQGAAQRTLTATKTSLIASLYAAQVILVRAAKHSKYANDSMEAGTGSLRYLVYALRSLKVLWHRVVDSLIGSIRNGNYGNHRGAIIARSTATSAEGEKQQRRIGRTLNPLRDALSGVRNSAASRIRRERSLRNKQQQLRAEETYRKKLRLLNLDRVTLERDRREVENAGNQLELDRRELLNEKVNVLAWYCAAREATESSSAAAMVEDAEEVGKEVEKKKEKRGWGFWR